MNGWMYLNDEVALVPAVDRIKHDKPLFNPRVTKVEQDETTGAANTLGRRCVGARPILIGWAKK